jgi:DNA-binding transcriptional MerR regulator
MKIGELAERSGLSASAIRFYEKKGLLPHAERLSSGYRSYDDNSLMQLQIIKFAQNLGFSLDEMVTLLGQENIDHDLTLQQLETKRQDIDSLINNLEEKKRSIDVLVNHLKAHWNNDRCVTQEALELVLKAQN